MRQWEFAVGMSEHAGSTSNSSKLPTLRLRAKIILGFAVTLAISAASMGIAYLGFEMHIAYADLRKIILDTCAQADLPDGYIRLNVTRGTGLGLDPKNIDRQPNVMVMVSTLSLYPPEKYEIGLTCNLSPIRVIPADSLDPRVKCIGRYASNILAKQIANRQGAGRCNVEGF